MGQRYRNLLLLSLILLLGVALRLYHFTWPQVDFLSWRDTQTLMVARNFFREGMNLFSPSVDWRTTLAVAPKGTAGGTELQVTPWLTAALYGVFGIQFWVGRVVPLAFAIFGTIMFYLLARRFMKAASALVSVLLLTVSPYFLFCGRVQMPEWFAFASSFGALYFFDRYIETEKKGHYLAAAVFTVLAITGKSPMIIIALPMAYLAIIHYGKHIWRRPALHLFPIIVAIPVGAYTAYSFSLIRVSGISFLQPSLMGYSRYLMDPGYYWSVGKAAFLMAVTPPVAVLAVAGLTATVRASADLRRFFPAAWLAGALGAFLLVPGGNAVNGYYHMILTPPAVLLAATALQWMFERSKLRLAGVAVLVVAAVWPLYYVKILYEPRYMSAYHCGEWVRQNTPKEALVLTSSPNPAALYFSDRVGWTSWTEYYGKGARFNKSLIEKVRPLGASIAAIDDADFDSAWSGSFNHVRDYLYQNFAAVHGDDFVVFRLDQPADLSLRPDKRIVFGINDTRHYLRGAWGPNQDDAEHKPCVAMGPAGESSIVFCSPHKPRRVLIELASAAAGQELTISINGAGSNVLAIPEMLQKGTMAIEPDVNVPETNEWTVTLAASRQNKNGASLLLYSLQAE